MPRKWDGRLAEANSLEAATQRFLNADREKRRYRRIQMEKKLMGLKDEDIKEQLKLTQSDLDALNDIIARPGRNSIARLAALKLKAQFTVAPPKQEVGVDGISVTVNTLAYNPDVETTSVTANVALPPKQEDEDA